MTLEDAITHIEQQMKNLHIAAEYEQALNYLCWLKELKVLRENILPRPVIRDGNGKLVKDYTPRDFYLKLQEEIFEAFEDKEYVNHYEIADIITVCLSYLNAIGYNENGRSEIFRRVNEKNEKHGYFKERDSDE